MSGSGIVKTIKIMKQEFYRLLVSFRIPGVILGITFIICFSNMEDITYYVKYNTGSVIRIFETTVNGGWFFQLIFLFTAPIGATGFCLDHVNGFYVPLVTRSDAYSYGLGKVLASMISVVFSVSMGIIVSILVLRIFMPFLNDEEVRYFSMLPYRTLLLDNRIFLYLAVRITLIAFVVSLWSAIGLVISTFKPELSYAICTPFILNYILGRLIIYLPDYLNTDYIVSGYPILGEGVPWQITYLYSALFIAIIYYLVGNYFTKRIERYVSGRFII